MNDRINLARTAYLKRNVEAMKKLHSQEEIDRFFQFKEEQNKTNRIPEIILGGQDGLVNVLGVILGVAAATSSTQIVAVAGLAAVFAESISMAAVAYTSKVAEADYYESEYEREKWEIEHVPEAEKEEVKALYKGYGFEGEVLDQIVEKITSNHQVWLTIMMEQELRLEPVNKSQALSSAIVVGVATTIGSFIPLLPFFVFPIKIAVVVAILTSSAALFSVGYYKAKHTLGRHLLRAGLEIMIIGMIAAFAGYAVGIIFKVPMGL